MQHVLPSVCEAQLLTTSLWRITILFKRLKPAAARMLANLYLGRRYAGGLQDYGSPVNGVTMGI
jgi:hypothetical protein